jgi:hypothetical protein
MSPRTCFAKATDVMKDLGKDGAESTFFKNWYATCSHIGKGSAPVSLAY